MNVMDMIAIATELAQLYQGFVQRAGTMTELQAAQEWAKINTQASVARAKWAASKT